MSKASYRDPSLPVEERVADLLGKMTLQEKTSQLGKLRGFHYYERRGDKVEFLLNYPEELKKYPVGTIYGIFRADWWTEKNWDNGITPELGPETINKFQRIAVEETRLGIPILFVEEAPHGLTALGTRVFPAGLGMGSSFDKDLLYRIGEAIGTEALQRGVYSIYAPILDLARDPRWSRCEECFGEDTTLVTELGDAETRGILDAGIQPTLKHYIGGGSAEGGHNTSSAHLGSHELFNNQLPPFRKAINSGAKALMSTYHDVDGEPCTGSRYLLNDILRGHLGFDGFVTADAGAVELLATRRMAKDLDHAAARSLTAGCDTASGKTTLAECGQMYLDAYQAGLISDEELDIAVGRILKVKFELGLFESPYADAASGKSPEPDNSLVLEAARKSLVLLKNESSLPLDNNINKIAVIGPNADNATNQLGDYTAPQKDGMVVTVREGVTRLAAEQDISVSYAKGCAIRKMDSSGFPEAVNIAKEADVTILVLGGASTPYSGTDIDPETGAFVVSKDMLDNHDKESGEGTDRGTLNHCGVQTELFLELRKVSRKLIVVLIQGRPLTMNEILDQADAVLMAWYPGNLGGVAVAEALFGEVNPSGRLPVSIPFHTGQLPVCSDSYTQKRPLYLDSPGDPRLEFGFGLSYTSFEYSELALQGRTVSVKVKNTGEVAGDEIVRFYLTAQNSEIQRAWRELFDFVRVSLRPGESRTVTMEIPDSALGYYDRQGEFVEPRGEFLITIADCEEEKLLCL